MELRQLEYLVAVAEEENFTRGAARVHVAQPGVSAQIKRLERELGMPLFDRSGRTVALTAAGKAVLPHARTVLRSVSDMRAAIDELTGLLQGEVRFGAVGDIAAIDLPSILADFHAQHPQVRVSLIESHTEHLLTLLGSGSLDLAVVATDERPPDDVAVRRVATTRLAVLVPAGHPFAERDELTVRDLGGERLVTLPDGTGVRRRLGAAMLDYGLDCDVVIEASRPTSIARFVEQGLGVGVLPVGIADGLATTPTLTTVPIVGDHAPTASIGLAWRRHGFFSPAARAFLEALRDATPERIHA